MTALAQIGADIAEAQENLRSLADRVRECDDPSVVQAATDRVRLAREWAKIQKVSAEMHADLMMLEATCLRQIGRLGALDLIGAAARPVAKYLAGFTDDALRGFVQTYTSTTVIGAYRLMLRDREQKQGRETGRAFALGALPADGDFVNRDMDRSVTHAVIDTRGALAALLAHYSTDLSTRSGFTISEMAQEVIDDLTPTYGPLEEGLVEGIHEVCRAAVRSAPVLEINGTKAPRFVTCLGPDGETYRRVPFENATIAQLNEMIALRREQLQQDTDALARLEDVAEDLRWADANSDERDPAETLGSRAARLAFRDSGAA